MILLKEKKWGMETVENQASGMPLFAAVFMVSACVAPKATSSGFLADYSELQSQDSESGLIRSVAIDAEAVGRYRSVKIQPVEILAGNLNESQKAAVAESLKGAMEKEFGNYWTLSEIEGEGVICIRAAVTDMHKSNVALNVISTAILAPVDFGTLSVEAEAIDSLDGTRLAALAWARRSGVKQTFQTFTPTGSGRALAPYFAEEFSRVLGKGSKPEKQPSGALSKEDGTSLNSGQ